MNERTRITDLSTDIASFIIDTERMKTDADLGGIWKVGTIIVM